MRCNGGAALLRRLPAADGWTFLVQKKGRVATRLLSEIETRPLLSFSFLHCISVSVHKNVRCPLVQAFPMSLSHHYSVGMNFGGDS